mmetsp:Transcript_54817/g.125311  ORF Transcript_54817/g.125311 Transcript_54817/m.125311 type:complete len:103 (-) Transcript_54817:68-376(-)
MFGDHGQRLGVVWRTKFSRAQTRALCMLFVCFLLVLVLGYQVFYYNHTVSEGASGGAQQRKQKELQEGLVGVPSVKLGSRGGGDTSGGASTSGNEAGRKGLR